MTDRITPERAAELLALKEVLAQMVTRADNEYSAMPQSELDNKWFFRFDAGQPIETNLYEFHKMLLIYSSACRRWEEMHNGNSCVVERVRDTYLMPKIREFVESASALARQQAAEIERLRGILQTIVARADRAKEECVAGEPVSAFTLACGILGQIGSDAIIARAALDGTP